MADGEEALRVVLADPARPGLLALDLTDGAVVDTWHVAPSLPVAARGTATPTLELQVTGGPSRWTWAWDPRRPWVVVPKATPTHAADGGCPPEARPPEFGAAVVEVACAAEARFGWSAGGTVYARGSPAAPVLSTRVEAAPVSLRAPRLVLDPTGTRLVYRADERVWVLRAADLTVEAVLDADGRTRDVSVDPLGGVAVTLESGVIQWWRGDLQRSATLHAVGGDLLLVDDRGRWAAGAAAAASLAASGPDGVAWAGPEDTGGNDPGSVLDALGAPAALVAAAREAVPTAAPRPPLVATTRLAWAPRRAEQAWAEAEVGSPAGGRWRATLDGAEVEPELRGGVLRVSLPPGLSTVEAWWEGNTGSGPRFRRAFEYRSTTADRPTLYVLAFGVSEYAAPGLDLAYAASDAVRVHDTLVAAASTEGSLLGLGLSPYAEVRARRWLDGEVTREAVEEARALLATAGPEDRVVWFLAGHGFLDAERRFWFGTVDVDPDHPERRGISFGDLDAVLRTTQARRRLLLLDACHAGQLEAVADTELPPLAAGVRGLALAGRPEGAGVSEARVIADRWAPSWATSTAAQLLAASSGAEYAYESADWEGGLFTRALLDALAGAWHAGVLPRSDADGDGTLSAAEWMSATRDRVEALAPGRQHPRVHLTAPNADFALFERVGDPGTP